MTINQAKHSQEAATKANNVAEKQKSKTNEIVAWLNNKQDELVEELHLQYKHELQLLEQALPTGHKIKLES